MPFEATRVSAAIKFLVVGVGDFCRHFEQVRAVGVEHLVANDGVQLHHRKFFGRELAGFEQNHVGRADLANVVHRGGLQQQVLLILGQAQNAGNVLGIVRHAQNVRASFGVAVFSGFGQAKNGFSLLLHQLGGGLTHFCGQMLVAFVQRQHVFGTCQKFGVVDRLVQKIGHANFKCLVAQLNLVVGGDHQHRGVGVAGAKTLGQFGATQLRHHEIHHHQVGVVVQAPLQCQHGVRETNGLAVGQLQHQMFEQGDVHLHVINDHDLHQNSRF